MLPACADRLSLALSPVLLSHAHSSASTTFPLFFSLLVVEDWEERQDKTYKRGVCVCVCYSETQVLLQLRGTSIPAVQSCPPLPAAPQLYPKYPPVARLGGSASPPFPVTNKKRKGRKV